MKMLWRIVFVVLTACCFLVSLAAEDCPLSSSDNMDLPSRLVQAGSAAFIVQDALYMFPEASDRVVAFSDGNQGKGSLAELVDKRAAEKTVLPRRVNTESIAALHPDTVVMKNFLKKSMGGNLEKMGLPVFYVDLESPRAWLDDVGRFGVLFGNESRAKEIQEHFRKRMLRVSSVTDKVREKDKPRVLFLYWSVKDGSSAVNVPPADWMQTRLVKMAGGIPVWLDGPLNKKWTRVNIEQISAWNPDEIIVAAYHIPADKALEKIYSDESWAMLDAVKNGRVKAMPSDFHSWDQPGASWILGLQWLAKNFHPSLFADFNMQEEVVSFYRDFFLQDESFVEKNVFPRLSNLD